MTLPQDALAGHQRLIALRELARLTGYSANDSYLQGVLRGMGLPCPREDLRQHLVWLAERDLVTLDLPTGPEGPLVPTLTEAGVEVATGVQTVEGVQRPSPAQAGSGALTTMTRMAIDRLRGRGSHD